MNAISVTSVTLVGVIGTPPLDRGNCFSVKDSAGEQYRIVNFVHENLEALLASGLTWPIECKVLAPGVAVINDPRIGERWFAARFCEICCPQYLLPTPQLLKHERDIARGFREEKDGMLKQVIGVEYQFP